MSQNKPTASRHSRGIRVLALILSILVCGSAFTVLLQLIFNIFG